MNEDNIMTSLRFRQKIISLGVYDLRGIARELYRYDKSDIELSNPSNRGTYLLNINKIVSLLENIISGVVELSTMEGEILDKSTIITWIYLATTAQQEE